MTLYKNRAAASCVFASLKVESTKRDNQNNNPKNNPIDPAFANV